MQAFIGNLEDSLLGTKKGQGIPRAYQGLSLSESILTTTLKPLQTHLQNKTKQSLFFFKIPLGTILSRRDVYVNIEVAMVPEDFKISRLFLFSLLNY